MKMPIKHYRTLLSSEDIKNILAKFDVHPRADYLDYMIYPTVNRNLTDGSPKLYYYKKDRMFKEYTGEGKYFDIFQLIIDMHNLKDIPITLRESIAFCGIDIDGEVDDSGYTGVAAQLDYLNEFNPKEEDEQELVIYPKEVLNRFVFDINGLLPWVEEGIGIETLRTYGVKYDQTDHFIAIPYFTKDNKLVGVRGRFLDPEAKAKYMPIKHGGKWLTHPTNRILYGLNINQRAIKEQKVAIIFEGEKSVMKMDTFFGRNSVALAVSGRRFSKEHLKLLMELEVRDIIVAFDRDYTNEEELKEEIESLKRMFAFASNIVNVSLIIDYSFVLGHKDSPIDQGKDIFDGLMEDRVFI